MDELDNKHETAEPSACDLFEELGYKKDMDSESFIAFTHKALGMVMFELEDKDILVTDAKGLLRMIKPKEILAIYKQIKELGWK